MQYEIGKEYILGSEPIPCRQGYHFCKSIADCYRFYAMSDDTRICEISATGTVKTDDGSKYCTNKIKILREIKNLTKRCNVSNTSSGYCNSGFRNSGNVNSGSGNSGNGNSGHGNSGDRNTGNYNTGNGNSGHCNSGLYNSGVYNSGNYNSGDWNSGDWNSGLFNTTKNTKIKIFDMESEWTMATWYRSDAYQVMKNCPSTYSDFISTKFMTKKEKTKHPEYKTIGGYVKTSIITDADRQVWWDSLSAEEKQAVYDIPNFDADKFEMCTGIKPI